MQSFWFLTGISDVPQAALLSPLLFAIYTANWNKSVEHSKMTCYLDDTQILFSFHPGHVIIASQKIVKEKNVEPLGLQIYSILKGWWEKNFNYCKLKK